MESFPEGHAARKHLSNQLLFSYPRSMRHQTSPSKGEGMDGRGAWPSHSDVAFWRRFGDSGLKGSYEHSHFKLATPKRWNRGDLGPYPRVTNCLGLLLWSFPRARTFSAKSGESWANQGELVTPVLGAWSQTEGSFYWSCLFSNAVMQPCA